MNDYPNEPHRLEAEQRSIGLEMHQVETVIHLGRQSLKDLKAAQPPDVDAISEAYTEVRAAHGRQHELAGLLAAVKIRRAEQTWPAIWRN